jgi:four helix bundle protein
MSDHRSLEAWRVARSVAFLVFKSARDHWRPWARALFDQLQRAALSVPLNIAEGWTFSASRSRTRHLAIAYGSAVETGEILSLVADLGLLPEPTMAALIEQNRRSQRLLVGLLKRCRPLRAE